MYLWMPKWTFGRINPMCLLAFVKDMALMKPSRNVPLNAKLHRLKNPIKPVCLHFWKDVTLITLNAKLHLRKIQTFVLAVVEDRLFLDKVNNISNTSNLSKTHVEEIEDAIQPIQLVKALQKFPLIKKRNYAPEKIRWKRSSYDALHLLVNKMKSML